MLFCVVKGMSLFFRKRFPLLLMVAFSITINPLSAFSNMPLAVFSHPITNTPNNEY